MSLFDSMSCVSKPPVASNSSLRSLSSSSSFSFLVQACFFGLPLFYFEVLVCTCLHLRNFCLRLGDFYIFLMTLSGVFGSSTSILFNAPFPSSNGGKTLCNSSRPLTMPLSKFMCRLKQAIISFLV